MSTRHPPTTDPPAPGSAPVYSDYVLRKAKETGLDPALIPDVSQLITSDDTPVESFFIEMQQRLLAHTVRASWPGPGEGRPFLVASNVGYFYEYKKPPVVPDVMLALEVQQRDPDSYEGRSYFEWILGRPPTVVIEIVSDRRGGEESHKQRIYLRRGVPVYIIFDPEEWLAGGVLRAFVLDQGKYVPHPPGWFPRVGLGLTLWPGVFEGYERTWLRWCDQNGQVIPTADESREVERKRAENAQKRARDARKRAKDAAAEAERLRAQLRALGVEPEA
jgi:Uma2 family endonuclease